MQPQKGIMNIRLHNLSGVLEPNLVGAGSPAPLRMFVILLQYHEFERSFDYMKATKACVSVGTLKADYLVQYGLSEAPPQIRHSQRIKLISGLSTRCYSTVSSQFYCHLS